MDITVFDGIHNLAVLWENNNGQTYDTAIVSSDVDIILFSGARTDRHKIGGVLTVDGLPAERVVAAFDRRTMAYIGGTTSKSNGAWELKGLPELPVRALMVVAMDTTGNYNAEIADYITQVDTLGSIPVVNEYCYPQTQSDSHVKATSFYSSGFYPWYGTDPNLPFTGGSTGTSWSSSNGSKTNQKFNIDFGSQKVIKRLHLENYHASGAGTDQGIKNFSVYGTNSSAAFANLTYADISDLTLLGTFTARIHNALNEADPQFFELSNDVGYRHVVVRIADNQGSNAVMAFVHLAFQIEVQPS